MSVHALPARGRRRATTPPWLKALMALSLLFAAGSVAYLLRQAFPQVPARALAALRSPAPAAAWPFPNCTAAHAAGVFDIPAGSPAYTPRQDRDRDGVACEAHAGSPRRPGVSLRGSSRRRGP